ncbi:MAG: hypothetical protein IKO57_08490 [Treponema sp.]|nr:hypothetical protein [Treponema sp.]
MNLESSAKKFIFSSKTLDMQVSACIIRRFADSQIRRLSLAVASLRVCAGKLAQIRRLSLAVASLRVCEANLRRFAQ